MSKRGKQKTIAIFIPSLRGGGAERNILRLAYGLSQRGYAVDLVLAKKEGPLVAFIPAGVRVFDLQSQRVLTSLPGLVRYLRQEQPDVLFSALDHANIIALWARRIASLPKRVVVSVRNTLSFATQNPTNRRSTYMPYFMRWFYPWAEAIVAVSQGVADDLIQSIPSLDKNQLQVIYNPVVTPELLAQSSASLNHPWFEDTIPVIVAVGRLTQQKDFPTLLRAFFIVQTQRPVRLIILGEGEERYKLESFIQHLGIANSVSLLGFVDNPAAYMAQAALFVLSSAWEGLPTVLIEALAAGTHVVSTDCKSGPREILDNGTYGHLVSVGDASAMAAAMLRSLAQEHDKELLKRRAMDFHVDVITEQYVEVLFGCVLTNISW